MGCRVDAQDANSVRQETPTFVGRLFGFLERLGGATGRFIATQYRRPGSINTSESVFLRFLNTLETQSPSACR